MTGMTAVTRRDATRAIVGSLGSFVMADGNLDGNVHHQQHA
jgi:hypothetical protein